MIGICLDARMAVLEALARSICRTREFLPRGEKTSETKFVDTPNLIGRITVSLMKLGSAADAYRLDAAAYCLDHGLAPHELRKGLGLNASVEDLQKFDPDQPRVPAGSGRESGR